MELLYVQEHLTCYNYEKGERPTIEKISLEKEQTWEALTVQNKIIFVLSGSIYLSYGKIVNKKISDKKMVILPAAIHSSIRAIEDSVLIVMSLHNTKRLCDCFPLDSLLREDKGNFIPRAFPLDFNERVESFLSFLDTCMTDGLKCTYFFELKTKEFYFLLRAYYTKQELLYFLHPILTQDIPFSELVLKNRLKAKTVQELASLTNYSLSGFQKRFKKAFGVSAYQWMKDEREKVIFHQINSTNKSFKEISEEFGFSSPSHFNDFCKASFGATPGIIRSKKTKPKADASKKA
ncbi:AraC family transcriptional regulator [Dysgonomonas sp. Marseille-P4361]|uniref:helix-turn-helix domain-containing protein n=1 Tax=Dysgonomonas sp. Marseille-P4361 TaxID=2161820 RepID=UPI000D55CC1B|nr:AraC family transcriptional regulator [Dysgonomonas sp. Marseille-P4361]